MFINMIVYLPTSFCVNMKNKDFIQFNFCVILFVNCKEDLLAVELPYLWVDGGGWVLSC